MTTKTTKPLADPETVRLERLRALGAGQALAWWVLRFGARGLRFVLFGAPRTKKNHGRVIWRKVQGEQRRFHVPSAPYEEWCNHVRVQLATVREPLPDLPYNCAAIFYRDANRGDAVGYYQGLADALEAAGVISDDKLITQWDGSRLRVDRKNPRVELTLTPVEE